MNVGHLVSIERIYDRTFHTVIFINMPIDGFVRLIIPQHLCHILTYEPRFAIIDVWFVGMYLLPIRFMC